MLTLPPGTRIYLALAPIDMRRSFDGLSAVVLETLQLNPLDGHLFLFRGKGGDKIKALLWDRNGFAIWYKRKVASSGHRKQYHRWKSHHRNLPCCSTVSTLRS